LGRKQAKDVVIGDEVVTSLPQFSPLMEAFLYGTLLGDASISLQRDANAKTPHIKIAHCVEDRAYVEWKRDILSALRPSPVRCSPSNRGFGKADGKLSHFTTSTDARLHDVYNNVCVAGKKSLNATWLQQLTCAAVALWYCDDGHLERGKYPVITSTVAAELRAPLVTKLRELGFDPRIRVVHDDVVRIYLTSGSPMFYWSLLVSYIPVCMSRKVPAKFLSLCGTRDWSQECLYTSAPYTEVVTRVAPLFEKNGRDGISRKFTRAREYCIAVEDNQNFFVNQGFCVSNCKFDMHFYAREGIQIKTKLQDTRILWHFYDENAPGALKIIASGWKDELGRQHKGLIDATADAKEDEIDQFRSKESKVRREAFRKLVMAEADRIDKNIEHQGKNRNQLKKWIAEFSPLKDHEYAISGKEDIDYSFVPISLMTEYAALDTFLTYQVYVYTVKNIEWTNALSALYKNEIALLRVLFDAEEHGVRIDRDLLTKAGAQFFIDMEALKLSITEKVGDINLQSTKQLADSLISSGVKLTKTTKDPKDLAPGEELKFALDKKVLEKLKNKHEIIGDILKLRELSKLHGTYVAGILEKLNDDNVLHCTFNQNVKTGRMSSQDPNLQNIPGSTVGKVIREAFLSWNADYIYVLADYSQIEVRLTAHYSQDPLLLDAYAKNQDIHTRTFCEMFGLDINEVAKILKDKTHPLNEEYNQLRTVAKRINFGIIYGVGAPGLSEQVTRPAQYKHLDDKEWIDQCQKFIDQYLSKYTGVKRFVNQGKRLVSKDMQLENYFGRVRHLPNADAMKILKDRKMFWMEARAQRQGVNFLIQGTAADLFKIAVVRTDKILRGKKSQIVNLVHDEIQMYIHKSELDVLPQIKHAMEDWHFTVPILADFSEADPSWGKKKGLEIHT